MQLTPAFRLFGDGTLSMSDQRKGLINLTEPDEANEDDSEEEDGDDDASETSSLVGNSRSRSISRTLSVGSSLPLSRNPSPLRNRVEEQDVGLVGRVTSALTGLVGGRRLREKARGTYDSLDGGHEQ